MKDIVLSVKRDPWRAADDSAEAADKDFAAIRQRALERDRFTCQFCDFQIEKWQDVHHVNDNHQDNRLENLVTACKICHACHHLGLAGMNGGGTMIYLPEVPQHVLNQFLRILFVYDRLGTPSHKRQGAEVWEALMSRKAPVESEWGTSDPREFANRLLTMRQEEYDRRDMAMLPLRFVIAPRSRMLGQRVIDSWALEGFSKIPINVWEMIANQVYQ